jgi:hypothetical protein
MADEHQGWIEEWLDAVVSGRSTMSQRSLRSIEAHGGIDPIVAAAKARGVHLVQLTDDKDQPLVAASMHPFKTLC